MTKEFFERGKQIAKWADNNMKQHKWQKEIKAWADGAEIEKWMLNDTWQRVGHPDWYEFESYRIKPQPVAPQYLYVYWGNDCSNGYHHFISDKSGLKEYEYRGKIPLIVESNDDL